MIDFLHTLASQPWYGIASATVTLASLVAAITPTQYDNKAAQWARKGLDLVALNFGSSLKKGR
ncbi:MAG: hypothetical protein QE263_04680 [Vampirovibrionales bacterium]|nr:hypothetical protein [Vampirovibrionales bacterium]